MEENNKTVQKLFDVFNRFSKLNWNNSPVIGLTPSEIFALISIKNLLDTEKQGVKVTQLSRVLGVAPPSVTQTINSLEEKGLVERNTNKKDRRAVQISLSESGNDTLDKVMDAYHKHFEGLVDYLGEEKSNELIDLLSMSLNYFSEL